MFQLCLGEQTSANDKLLADSSNKIFLLDVIPTWQYKLLAVMLLVALTESLAPVFGDGCPRVVILIDGFFKCCKEIFQGLE